MKNKIYLDYNATTPTHPKVVKAMMPYLDPDSDLYGNPSSVYTLGQETRRAIDEARTKVANLLGATPEEIVFTSCGSESDTTAIKGVAFSAKERNKGNHLITSAIEHDCVSFCFDYLKKMGWDVTVLPVDSNGVVSLESVKNAVRPDTVLVSIMHANNEIGTIQPIPEIGAFLKEKGIPFHSDSIQTVGKIPTKVDEMNVDLLSLSAHKFYGPKGVGALYIRKGTRLHPLFHGHHEKNRRAGTENVAGIVGCGVACDIAAKEMAHDAKRIAQLRDRLEKGIIEKVPHIRINGHMGQRIPGTSNISFEYVEGEGCVFMLDVEGISVSTGSACASGTTKASHVLKAIGVPGNVAQGTVRFSLGHYNTDKDITTALKVIPKVIERLRSMSPIWADKVAGAPTNLISPDRLTNPSVNESIKRGQS